MSRTVATVDPVQIERTNRARRLIPLVLLAECVAVGGLTVAIRAGVFPELAGLATPLGMIAVLSGFAALVMKMAFSRRP
jgi:hypothetical protein